jgi:hypothetical protein
MIIITVTILTATIPVDNGIGTVMSRKLKKA